MYETASSNPASPLQQKLCYYCNHTSKVQVGLITNIPGRRVEQVLFPGQRWMFWADPDAVLAIYDSEDLTHGEVQRITCEHLQVLETD